jgi:hypothetical protein
MNQVKKSSKNVAANAGRILENPTSVQVRAKDGRIVRLGDPEAAENFTALKMRLKTDREYAAKMLRSAGILTAGGNLSKRFGG